MKIWCGDRTAAGVDPYDPNAEAPYEIVSFTNSFHGRTMGALALTYKEQYKTPFQPVMPGAVMVPYQDLEAAAQVIKKVTTPPLVRKKLTNPPSFPCPPLVMKNSYCPSSNSLFSP